ncbi:MAG: adenylate/guanylate cyclase domain-containing protein [Alphaproteobacteria bacterium]
MARLYTRTIEWRFDRPPEAIWPALADTARFNEAAGLPKHGIEQVGQPDGSVRFFARARKGPFELAWEEIPVEWVDAQWFRHLRIFSKGPIRTLSATLRLEPDGRGGTLGRYTIDATAANLLGTLMLKTVFLRAAERTFTRLAESARDWAAGERETPFEVAPARLSAGARARLDAMLSRIEASANGHGLARRLAEWVQTAQEVDLMRIRPLALARRWDMGEREVVEMCLQAVREGLLELRWDLLCPRCRGAKLAVDSLDRLPSGAHCDSCNVDYDRDFARNIELTFHPAPAVREVIDGEFCLFGPMSTPHVKAQVALEPGESRTLPARLAPGDYRVRTLERGGESDIAYAGGGFPEVTVEGGAVAAGTAAGDGEIRLVNNEDRRRTLIIESRDWVRDALTAHRVTTMQTFRDLFSDEALRPGDEAGISQVTLMFTDLKGSTALYGRVGDAAAYRLVREHFAYLAGAVREHNGTVVKTIGDAVMAAFADPADAVRAAQALQAGVKDFNAASGGEDIVIKLGLHGGPCIAVTLNGRLDYFGTTVNMAARLQGESEGNDIVLSEDLAADPAVAAILSPYELAAESRGIKGFDRPITFRRLTGKALVAG